MLYRLTINDTENDMGISETMTNYRNPLQLYTDGDA